MCNKISCQGVNIDMTGVINSNFIITYVLIYMNWLVSNILADDASAAISLIENIQSNYTVQNNEMQILRCFIKKIETVKMSVCVNGFHQFQKRKLNRYRLPRRNIIA